jgi:hypothetical protein
VFTRNSMKRIVQGNICRNNHMSSARQSARNIDISNIQRWYLAALLNQKAASAITVTAFRNCSEKCSDNERSREQTFGLIKVQKEATKHKKSRKKRYPDSMRNLSKENTSYFMFTFASTEGV